MKRIVIIGTSCSGKTTLAKQLAKRLNIQHVELDELFWKPGWQERDREEFRILVNSSISGGSWVIDGNHSKVRDIIWPRATTIIWLDYSFSLVFFRALKRALIRIVTKQEICAGNKETFQKTFFSRGSILLWVIKTYRSRKLIYPELLRSKMASHVEVITLKTPGFSWQNLIDRIKK
ncbi:AAA family ATPase [bacterium]|nr:AAA family ATPase [bacterium]